MSEIRIPLYIVHCSLRIHGNLNIKYTVHIYNTVPVGIRRAKCFVKINILLNLFKWEEHCNKISIKNASNCPKYNYCKTWSHASLVVAKNPIKQSINNSSDSCQNPSQKINRV